MYCYSDPHKMKFSGSISANMCTCLANMADNFHGLLMSGISKKYAGHRETMFMLVTYWCTPKLQLLQRTILKAPKSNLLQTCLAPLLQMNKHTA